MRPAVFSTPLVPLMTLTYALLHRLGSSGSGSQSLNLFSLAVELLEESCPGLFADLIKVEFMRTLFFAA
jgi:hypothetical protein